MNTKLSGQYYSDDYLAELTTMLSRAEGRGGAGISLDGDGGEPHAVLRREIRQLRVSPLSPS